MTAPTFTGARVTPTGLLVLPADTPRDVWLADRRRGLGSSDIPAVMQVSNYRTPLHVYHDKVGNLPVDDGQWSEAAHFGNVLEEPLALDWARRNSTVVSRVGLIANDTMPWQQCTLDRLCAECPLDRDQRSQCALEVKTRNAYVAKLWRSGPPDDVLAQVLWQIIVTGLEHIHVVCLIGGQDYRQYTVRRSEHTQLVDYILTEATTLWQRVLDRRPPLADTNQPPDALIELYQRLHPSRDGVVHIDRDGDAQDALSDYLDACADAKRAETAKKAAYARMVAALGPAQMAVRGGRPAYSIEQSTRRNVDLERLAERWPGAYTDCVSENASDRLSIPQAVRKEHAA